MPTTYVAAVTRHAELELRRLRCRAVGFNPFRQQDKTGTDIVIVVVFLVITLLVVGWALLGS